MIRKFNLHGWHLTLLSFSENWTNDQNPMFLHAFPNKNRIFCPVVPSFFVFCCEGKSREAKSCRNYIFVTTSPRHLKSSTSDVVPMTCAPEKDRRRNVITSVCMYVIMYSGDADKGVCNEHCFAGFFRYSFCFGLKWYRFILSLSFLCPSPFLAQFAAAGLPAITSHIRVVCHVRIIRGRCITRRRLECILTGRSAYVYMHASSAMYQITVTSLPSIPWRGEIWVITRSRVCTCLCGQNNDTHTFLLSSTYMHTYTHIHLCAYSTNDLTL